MYFFVFPVTWWFKDLQTVAVEVLVCSFLCGQRKVVGDHGDDAQSSGHVKDIVAPKVSASSRGCRFLTCFWDLGLVLLISVMTMVVIVAVINCNFVSL